MEKSGKLKLVVYLLLGILVLELGILTFAIHPRGYFIWISLLSILIVGLYLGVLCVKLINFSKETIDKP